MSIKGKETLNAKEYYSAASYCFGSNVKVNQVILEIENRSVEQYKILFRELNNNIDNFDEEIKNREIKTITDLESYMIVKERLIDAKKYSNESQNFSLSYRYAYANQRLNSAYAWAEFFSNQGKEFVINNEVLKMSCRQRLAEAEERLQYASMYLPLGLKGARDALDLAYQDLNNDEPALCLFKASKAKAEVNIILSSLSLKQDSIIRLIDNKIKAATRVILKAEKKGMFPVLGYSYYEYSNNLKETDNYLGLLYAEYALELSNLDMYFKEKEDKPLFTFKFDLVRAIFSI
jgi:predicted S18 family serine protease